MNIYRHGQTPFEKESFMPLEAELKFPVNDFDEVEERLRSLDAAMTHDEAGERNAILDNREGELRSSGWLLRLREYGGTVSVTVKEPVIPGPVKSRMEHEIRLEKGFEDYLRLFRSVGCVPVYSYTKTRAIWKLSEVEICLDTLDFGKFVEIEAETPEKVLRAASRLGFRPEEGLSLGYGALESVLRG